LGIEPYVRFCGWLKDISIVYSDLDILALTSMNEGTPVSIIEAMASSVPVIATEAGGVVDLIGVGNTPRRSNLSNGFKICERGILCRKNDAAGFSNGLRYLMDIDPNKKEKMLSQACAFVKQKYSHSRLYKNIEEIYLDLTKDNHLIDTGRFQGLQPFQKSRASCLCCVLLMWVVPKNKYFF
jgi:glycosyltransferase involved in cell wall biosynthesis